MDDDFRFYKLTPLLVKMSRICDRTWSCIVNLPVWGSASPSDEDFEESKSRIFERFGGKNYEDFFIELRKCLDDEELRSFIGRSAKDIQRAIDRLLSARTPKECANAANLIYHWINDLESWIHEQRLAYFGEWGRRFMYWAIEESSEKEINRFARQWGPVIDEESTEKTSQAGTAPDDTSKNYENLDVTILEEQFAVSVGNQECVLGNTKPFRLLLVLAKSPNQFIACQRIVDLMGEDSLSIGSLKQTKYLLVQALRGANCETLADAVVADRDHYGLFPDRQRLKLLAHRVDHAIDRDFTEQ